MTDDLAETPNPPPHVHHYVIKGSGLSCWAECAVIVGGLKPAEPIHRCGHKLTGDNGPIVGSKAKVERAIEDAE